MILPDQRKRDIGLKDLKTNQMFVGLVVKLVIRQMNVVPRLRQRRIILLILMNKLQVSFLLFLMNHFLNLQVHLMNIETIKTLILIMIQMLVYQEKIVLVLELSIFAIVHLRFKFFQIILTKLFSMLFNTLLMTRLGIIFS